MLPIKEEVVKDLYLKAMKGLMVEEDSFKSILKENTVSSLDDTVAVELTQVQQEIE